jgi:glycosyltransferase involved in cell wall biosynthesis
VKLSVVIPTRDRRDVIARTLAALARQRAPHGGWEAVVVDNGSHDATLELLTAAAEGFPVPLHVLEEPRPGPAAARNVGTRVAEGEVVLYLGDDTAPADEEFLRGHARLHADAADEWYAVVGRVAWPPGEATDFMEWAARSGVQFGYGMIDRGFVAADRFFYTSNLSIRRATVLEVGGFDERYASAALEDVDLGARLAAAGLRLWYEPELIVLHDHPTTLDASLRRTHGIGRSAALFNSVPRENPLDDPGRLRLAVLTVVRPLLRLLALLPTPPFVRTRAWGYLHQHAYVRGYREAVGARG